MPIVSPAGGSGGGGVQLFFQALGAPAASIDSGAAGFSGSFTSLLILIQVRTNTAATNVAGKILFNNDSGGNYDRTRLQTVNTTVTGATGLAQTSLAPTFAANTLGAGVFSTCRMFIPAYSATTAQKSGELTSGIADPTAANCLVEINSFNWRSTAAITRVSIASSDAANLLAGSSMVIYGLT